MRWTTDKLGYVTEVWRDDSTSGLPVGVCFILAKNEYEWILLLDGNIVGFVGPAYQSVRTAKKKAAARLADWGWSA